MTLQITYGRNAYKWEFQKELSDEKKRRWENIYREDVEQEIRENILNECLGWEKAMAKEHREFKKIKIKWF